MPRHRKKGRAKLPQRERQRPGGLRSIQHERHPACAAERRDLLDRQDIAKYVGHMRAEYRPRPPVTAASNARSVSSGSKSRRPAILSSAPAAVNGRQTALCSNPEITTSSPECTSERTAMFSACVAFIVKTTCSASAPNSSAAICRQR